MDLKQICTCVVPASTRPQSLKVCGCTVPFVNLGTYVGQRRRYVAMLIMEGLWNKRHPSPLQTAEVCCGPPTLPLTLTPSAQLLQHATGTMHHQAPVIPHFVLVWQHCAPMRLTNFSPGSSVSSHNGLAGRVLVYCNSGSSCYGAGNRLHHGSHRRETISVLVVFH